MNNVIISGNLVRDVDLKFAQSGMAIARMTVAVQRKFVSSTNMEGSRR